MSRKLTPPPVPGPSAPSLNSIARPRTDYLRLLLEEYFPLHFFALFRAHELYNLEPYTPLLTSPILDLGCGDGLVTQLLFGRVLEFGIDPLHNAVVGARARDAYKVVFRGSAHHIALQDRALGGIFSNCVLEHIPDLSSVIREVATILKPGAYFLASALTPFYYSMNPLFRVADRPLLGGLRRQMIAAENKLHNHVSVFDVEHYDRLFESAGMSLVLHRYYATRPVARFSNLWDTASKYVIPFPVGLSHNGLLVKLLKLRYGRGPRARDLFVRKWYPRLHDLCYSRNEANEVGVGQILVARKL